MKYLILFTIIGIYLISGCSKTPTTPATTTPTIGTYTIGDSTYTPYIKSCLDTTNTKKYYYIALWNRDVFLTDTNTLGNMAFSFNPKKNTIGLDYLNQAINKKIYYYSSLSQDVAINNGIKVNANRTITLIDSFVIKYQSKDIKVKFTNITIEIK